MHRRTLLTGALATLATGCASFRKAWPDIKSTLDKIIDAAQVLDIIAGHAGRFFRHQPDAEKQSAYEHAMLVTRTALHAATDAQRGGTALAAGDQDAAFAEFVKAYKRLFALLESYGIVSSDGALLGVPSPLGAPAEPLRVPTPLAIQ